MRIRLLLLTLSLMLLVFVPLAGAQSVITGQPAPTTRKLIEFGWNSPNPAYLRANIARMEAESFDGTVVNLTVGPMIFTRSPHPDEAFIQDRDDLAATTFTRFTDNFVLMWGTAEQDWSFASESDWAAMERNLRNFMQVAAAGRLRGVLLDPEPYQYSAWWYNRDRYNGLEFEQAQELVRARGAQFVQIVQEYIPDARILAIFAFELVRAEIENRGFGLRDSPWALYGAFLEGILVGANETVRLVDGNQASYYYTNAQQFADSRVWIADAIHKLPEDPFLRTRFDTHVEIGQAVYVDAVMNLRENPEFIGFHLPGDAERLQLLEHNLYQAIYSSDEYVWIYSENVHWWEDQVPPGVREALVSARDKAAAGLPLGFEVDGFVQAALEATTTP